MEEKVIEEGSSILWWRGGKKKKMLLEKQREFNSLMQLKRELSGDLRDLKADYAKKKYSETCMGRIYYSLGYVFSIYCIGKVLLTVVNIFFLSGRRDVDPVSRFFQLLSTFFNVELFDQYAQLTSFALVGILTFNSVRGFLTSLRQIFHLMAVRVKLDETAMVVILTEVTGSYFISFALMMKGNLPDKFGIQETADIFSLQNLFDKVFLCSFIVSSFVLYFLNRQKIHRAKAYSKFA
eukprot:snap_masked-scaffold_14-processed-gene-9.4-mRNA-1 protein AED:1.00 eAED:1.00 QI:0/-1/0/0/-1/1/1/0/236